MTAKDLHAVVCGDGVDLDFAVEALKSGPICIVKVDKEYWLKAPRLDVIDDPEMMYNAAEQLISQVNQSLLLLDSGQGLLTVNAVKWLDDNGKEVGIGRADIACRVRIRGCASVNIVQADDSKVPPELSLSQKCLALIGTDAALARAMRFWSQFEHNGTTLYKIYEIICSDVGGDDAVAAAGWTTKVKQSAFRVSVNSANIIGDQARHAGSTSSTPAHTMTLADANGYIRALLSQWIEGKYSEAKRSGRL